METKLPLCPKKKKKHLTLPILQSFFCQGQQFSPLQLSILSPYLTCAVPLAVFDVVYHFPFLKNTPLLGPLISLFSLFYYFLLFSLTFLYWRFFRVLFLALFFFSICTYFLVGLLEFQGFQNLYMLKSRFIFPAETSFLNSKPNIQLHLQHLHLEI